MHNDEQALEARMRTDFDAGNLEAVVDAALRRYGPRLQSFLRARALCGPR